jgi:hypothetical protein
MLALGLSSARYKEFRATLCRSHEMKVTCLILTPEHQVVRTITESLEDGQVDVTTPKRDGDSVEISRTASLVFFDPFGRLALDDTTPTDNAFYLNRMIRVIYSVRCSFGWVDVPVFTGPIVDLERDAEYVSVECQGKEVWALGSSVRTGVLKGTRFQVTRSLLERAGETRRRIDIPSGGSKTSVTLARDSKLWIKAWKLQAAADRVLFYDGRGVAKARRKPSKPALTLRLGDGQLLLSQPRISYEVDDSIINYARVTGRKPSKGKKRPVAVVTAPASHPLSPKKLGRNGQPLHLTGDGQSLVNNPDIKTDAGCYQVGKRMIEDSLMQHVVADIETFPIPDLEPWDVLQVNTSDVSVRIRANQFTLPLVQRGDGEAMSIGALKNTRRVRLRSKRKGRRR